METKRRETISRTFNLDQLHHTESDESNKSFIMNGAGNATMKRN